MINRIHASAISALLMAGLAHSALADSPVSCSVTVTGQNNSTVDLPAVQAAVNQPSASGDVTVCLAGVLDFGPVVPPTVISVNINPNPAVTSLRIVGLNAANGTKATIRNGILDLSVFAGPTLQSLTIANLRFEQPTYAAVAIFATNGLIRVSGLEIAGVRTYLDTSFNLSFREGIVVTSPLGSIAGEIDISGNVIDGGTYSPTEPWLAGSSGIELVGALPGFTQQPFTASVHVSDNRLFNWSGSGISAVGISGLTIERNEINPGRFANLFAGCAQPNGVGVANGIGLANITNSTVRDNVITLVPARTSTGAPPECTAGLILAGTAGATSSGNVIYRNQIRGTGSYGIVLGTVSGTPDGSVETSNVFALNPTLGFAAQNASLYLGPSSNGNVLVGLLRSIEGNTAGNVVISTP
jgi:hypothetical protein